MKKKIPSRKILAVSIASALSSHSVAADVSISGSIRTGIQYDGAKKTWAVRNVGSRLSFNSATDLSDEQRVFASYQFGIDSAKGSIRTGDTQRLSFVGIKGDWGAVSLGAQWSMLFNTVGTFMDKGAAYGGLGYLGPYRVKNTVSYHTQAGPVFLQTQASLSEGGSDIDRVGIGGRFDLGDLTVGLAYRDGPNSDWWPYWKTNDFVGVAASMPVAGMMVSGGYTKLNGPSIDELPNGGAYGFSIGGTINTAAGDLYLNYSESDLNNNNPDDAGPWVVGNYAYGLGGGAKLIFEMENNSVRTRGIGILRYDF